MLAQSRQDLVEQFERHMKRAGLKDTKQRRLVLNVFLDSTGHVSVEDLQQLIRQRQTGIASSTVYRAVRVFIEAGIANELILGDGRARYEPDWGEHHDHLICEDCGHIFEFEDPLIEAQQTIVASQHGLKITTHRHKIFGQCLNSDACPNAQASMR